MPASGPATGPCREASAPSSGGTPPRPSITPTKQRDAQYEERWQRGGFAFIGSFGDTSFNKAANDLAADFIRRKIKGIVHDPAVAEVLCPEQPVGCKRMALDTGYFETFNRENVTLIDISQHPIEYVDGTGLSVNGEHYRRWTCWSWPPATTP